MQLLQHPCLLLNPHEVVNDWRLLEPEVVLKGKVKVIGKRYYGVLLLHSGSSVVNENPLDFPQNVVAPGDLFNCELAQRHFIQVEAQFAHEYLHLLKAEDGLG